MSIIFDWYENPKTSEDEEEVTLHPRIVMGSKVKTATLYRKIHQRSSLTEGDAKSAIDSLADILAEELSEGHSVHIEGIGYFYPTLTAAERVTKDTPSYVRRAVFKTVRFRPDKELKGYLSTTHAQHTNYGRHSLKVSKEDMDVLLTKYFAEHRMMNRRDFQGLCMLTRTTAKTYLARLREEGKLVNIGLPNQPIYVPAPGYYGASSDQEKPTR